MFDELGNAHDKGEWDVIFERDEEMPHLRSIRRPEFNAKKLMAYVHVIA